jgi:Polyketide cyclase / dehydrase and lipid transport
VNAFAEVPEGRRGSIIPTGGLPVEGSVELHLPLDELWDTFRDVSGWHSWNPCIWRAKVIGGRLEEDATLVWAFNPIDRRYRYKLPAVARIVDFRPYECVTWEVSLPGLHALHSYRFAELDAGRCRFGSWEVGEGGMYRGVRRFWLAHFRFVCESSLRGAAMLAQRRAYSAASVPTKNEK